MKKPISENYYSAPHLQHLSHETQEKLFIADLIMYKESLQKDVIDKDILDFSGIDVDNEEVLI